MCTVPVESNTEGVRPERGTGCKGRGVIVPLVASTSPCRPMRHGHRRWERIPTQIMTPVRLHTDEGYILACIERGVGRCANMQASVRLTPRMTASNSS